ncbi:MAG: Asd/ArgC dimerization domain-containing protein [Bryobacteraceae bacterium]
MRASTKRKVALIGSDTLLGREVRDVCATGDLPLDLELFTEVDEEAGRLTAQGDEPAILSPIRKERLTGARAVVLAGAPDSARSVLAMELGCPIIDVTHTAEDHPAARLRAPIVERDIPPLDANAVSLIASPAAVTLALLIGRLHESCPITRSVAHVFEPASERGQKGLTELQQQTASLLSFRSLPHEVYDTQAAFNMLASFGEEAPESLESIELRIERHLASLLAGWRAPMPSLRLLQAPVFHGYTVSLWVEFAEPTREDEVAAALEGNRVELYGAGLEPPTNVRIAGQPEVAVGGIRRDRNQPRAFWLWAAADNLRLSAENALAVAQEVV